MNKGKKAEYKKTLVRHPEQTLSKKESVTGKSKKEVSTTVETKKRCDDTEFDLPQLYSTLQLSKKLEEIKNPRKTKSLTDVKKALAVDEKVSRKVNFPYDQPIYKDLISLKTFPQPQVVSISRLPQPQKDVEPNLMDFIEKPKKKEYYYQPEVALKSKTVTQTCNSLRLYKLLQIDNEIM